MFWSSLGYMVPGKAQRRCMNTRSRLALSMDVQEPLQMPRCQGSFSRVPICSISHIVTPRATTRNAALRKPSQRLPWQSWPSKAGPACNTKGQRSLRDGMVEPQRWQAGDLPEPGSSAAYFHVFSTLNFKREPAERDDNGRKQ